MPPEHDGDAEHGYDSNGDEQCRRPLCREHEVAAGEIGARILEKELEQEISARQCVIA
jgi:hypothetical protein